MDAVVVENLSKTFRVYRGRNDTLKGTLAGLFSSRVQPEEFWALRDVGFSVVRGETFGIIGENGSGKSTLLKILCGILKPDQGDVQLQGKVAALLELGAGFHGDLTCRENIYLNGSLLGFSKRQIDARFDEIVAFAELGDFIDTPIRHYSSGMQVRLGFAIAVNVDPDILLIDEVLAVGDEAFRKKCKQKMEDFRARQKTILIVTHDLDTVERWCDRALWLERGKVCRYGTALEAVASYRGAVAARWDAATRGLAPETVERHFLAEPGNNRPQPAVQSGEVQCDIPPGEEAPFHADSWPRPGAFLDISELAQNSRGAARCAGVALCNRRGQPCRVFEQGDTASFFYEFELLHDIEVPIGGLVIQDDKGVIVHGKSTLEYGTDVPAFVMQGSRLRFRQDIALEIGTGEYTFEVGLAAMGLDDYGNRGLCTHSDLTTKIVPLCRLPGAGQFSVVFRTHASPVQLLHHGVANLSGDCRVTVHASHGAGGRPGAGGMRPLAAPTADLSRSAAGRISNLPDGA